MENTIQVTFNPLLFNQLQESYNKNKQDIDIDIILGALCWPESKHDIDSIMERYERITTQNTKLIFAPQDRNLLDKIIYPIRQSKACFVLGNFISTISLCGYVAEMLCILIYNMMEVKINKVKITQQQEKTLFGSKFENLRQVDRVEKLKLFNFIDDDIKIKFDKIRGIRSRYLHFYSEESNKIEDDAIDIYNYVQEILLFVTGTEIKDNLLIMRDVFFKYLKEKGCIK